MSFARKQSLVMYGPTPDPHGVVLFLMLLAPTVMGVASAVERRLGASAAGWVTALPVALAAALVAVGIDLGDHAAAVMAMSAAGQVAAQVAFAVTFVEALRQRGLLVGLLAGAAGYAAASAALACLPPAAGVTAAVVALLVGHRLVRPDPAETSAAVPRRRRDTALACLVPALIVGAVIGISRLAGPVAAGAIAAFPTLSATLAISIGRFSGRPAAARALEGLVRSLPCYLAVCLVVALTAPAIQLLPAVAVALVACVATGKLTWRTLPMPAAPALAR
jgi:hypothetical protein